MHNEKVDFDLSELSLNELIKSYYAISDFIQFLDDNKIELEEESDE